MAMKYTIDQAEIREWIEAHSGVPAVLKEVSEDEGEESDDMLHISFDPNDPDMEEMEWDEFFERFDNDNLALVYDDLTPKGTVPDFELVDRDRARAEYAPEMELPDSGDADVLRENTNTEGETETETEVEQ